MESENYISPMGGILPPAAADYVRSALLKEKENSPSVYQDYLCAAWVCDDYCEDASEQGQLLRRKALDGLNLKIELTEKEYLQKLDIMRRLSLFDEIISEKAKYTYFQSASEKDARRNAEYRADLYKEMIEGIAINKRKK